MSIALVLAGHGSHLSPNTAGVVWNYVDQLRQRGIVDEVTAAFWKEHPEFSQVLKTLTSETVIVIPLFTASGYFSQQIIPFEMQLTGNITKLDNRTVYYMLPIGEHPTITSVVIKRVQDVVRQYDLPKYDTAVAIIGHGTKRNKTTRDTTKVQVAAIEQANLAAIALDAYLDDDPNIPSIYERIMQKHLIAVPFFLAPGSHATMDVPEALRITYGECPAKVDDHLVYYTQPIGTEDVILDIIIQLMRDTGIEFEQKPSDGEWDNMPRFGASELIEAVTTNRQFQFGQLILEKTGIFPTGSTRVHQFSNPSDLRRHIREAPFRPLTSSDDLPVDWCVPIQAIDDIPAVVETVYPGALSDWLQNNVSSKIESFHSMTANQLGMYRQLSEIDAATVTHFVTGVCGRCIKHPAWHTNPVMADSILCQRPCNLFLSTVKEADINDGHSVSNRSGSG